MAWEKCAAPRRPAPLPPNSPLCLTPAPTLLLLVRGIGRAVDRNRVAGREGLLHPGVQPVLLRCVRLQVDIIDRVTGVGGRPGALASGGDDVRADGEGHEELEYGSD